MRALSAQLSGDGKNADRVLVADNAVLVLDGASAFEPVPVDPGEYAETLGRAVARQLAQDPGASIAEAVAGGISIAADVLGLRPGYSPSSTIAILRTHAQSADLYVLGDSPIFYGTESVTNVLRDDRLMTVAEPQRAAYVAALRGGRGYGSAHQDALVALQQAQRAHRNRTNGYWIAEADPAAAEHGFTTTIDSSDAGWAVLGTDGATDLIAAVDPHRWPDLAGYEQDQLDEFLRLIHKWERNTDPDGQQFPRAKRHDDKTIAVIPNIFSDATDRVSPSCKPLPVRPLPDFCS